VVNVGEGLFQVGEVKQLQLKVCHSPLASVNVEKHGTLPPCHLIAFMVWCLDTGKTVAFIYDVVSYDRVIICRVSSVLVSVSYLAHCLQLFDKEMEDRSASAPDPKIHEKYVDFKKKNHQLLLQGKNYTSDSVV
jgi:hypothetical protein